MDDEQWPQTLEARRQLINDARREGYLMAIEHFEEAQRQGYQAPVLHLRSKLALWGSNVP